MTNSTFTGTKCLFTPIIYWQNSTELVSNTYRLVSFPYSIFLHTKDYISYPAWILLTRYQILIHFNIPYSEIVFDISRISYRSSSPFPAPTKSNACRKTRNMSHLLSCPTPKALLYIMKLEQVELTNFSCDPWTKE